MMQRLIDSLHWSLVLAGLLLPAVLNVGYHVLTLEVLATLLLSLLLGGVLGLAFRPGSLIGALIMAAGLVLWLHVYFPKWFPGMWACGGAFILAAALFLLTRGKAARIAGIGLGVSVIGAALQAPTVEPTLVERTIQSGYKPSVIHILADEHASHWGMPADIFTQGELDALWKPFVDRGFILFDRGFSREGLSQRSYATMMNPGTNPELVLKLSGSNWEILRTTLLERIAGGRKLDVTGINYMDLSQALGRIPTLSRFTSQNIAVAPSTLAAYGVSPLDRLHFAAASTVIWLTKGQKVPAVTALLNHFPELRAQLESQSRSYTITALEGLQRFSGRLRQQVRGTYAFAHILLPHYRYSFRSDCTVRPPGDWKSRLPHGSEDTLETRRERYRLYFEQMQCLHSRLLAMLDGLRATPAFRDATVIIHGDHGSRIAFRDKDAWLKLGRSEAEFERDWRATFVAVQLPGGTGTRIGKPANVAEVFRLLVETDFTRMPIEDLTDRDPTLGE